MKLELTPGRRRKVKCDEIHPRCSGCVRFNVKCQWPSPTKPSLSHDDVFEIEKLPSKPKYHFVHYKGGQYAADQGKKAPETSDSERHAAELPKSEEPEAGANWIKQEDTETTDWREQEATTIDWKETGVSGTDELLVASPSLSPENDFFQNQLVDKLYHPEVRYGQVSTFSPDRPSPELIPLSPFSGLVPCGHIDNPYLFQAFLDGFLNCVSPQMCHPQLLPQANFVPYAMQTPIMIDVFNACAASFLSKTNPDMKIEAKKRYSVCLRNFANSLSKARGEVEEWMVAAVILLCLRDKFSGSLPIVPASHLAKALELIRQLRQTNKLSTVSLKFLVESFLFNYTVMLLTGTKEVVQRLPSPFEVYDEWRPVLDHTPFRTALPFMKYPVFGAARHFFEIAAKVSWLYSQLPLSPTDKATACELLGLTYTTPLPEILEAASIELLPHEIARSQESIYLADIMQKCCILLLHKLLFPNLERDDPLVQEIVGKIIDSFCLLSADSPIWIVCTWPLLVSGITAASASHQHYIYALCQRCISRFLMGFLDQVCTFLVSVWGTDTEMGIGWDCLLEREVILRVYL